MSREQMIKDAFRIAGLLEGLTCLQGQTMTEAVAFALADCVDRLELMGAQLLAKDVNPSEGTEEDDWPKEYCPPSY